MSLSTAIGNERRERISGISIRKGNYDYNTGNLPQIIAVFGEANTANQGSLSLVPYEFTNSNEVGVRYGFGSPLHQIARILRPKSGDGVGGIYTIVIPQATSGSATATSVVIGASGTANANVTHSLIVNGRNGIDSQKYSYNIAIGDTLLQVHQKMVDAVNAVLGAPITGAATGVSATFITKWKGLTSAEIDIDFDVNGNNAGITYAIVNRTNGAGDVSLTSSFEHFGETWYTCVINPYASKLAEFEAFNGVPGDNATGRYSAQVFKPFHAFFGSKLAGKDALALITNNASRVEQVTNVLCPAPNSKGFSWEAAANVVYRVARIAQDNPHQDVNNVSYPDMPIPLDSSIGEMADYNVRDFLVKKGCSTVILENGTYKIQSLVTTYHPESDADLVFSYVRDNILYWNIKDSYITLEKLYLRDKTTVRDNQIVTVQNCIKPKEWKATVSALFDEEAQKAIISDPQFSKDSLQVEVSTVNPNRFETFFKVKITSVARIQSTTFEVNY